MLEQARASFQAIIKTHAWVGSLANILPLSALIDFLNTPQALHVYQLTGLIPLWCWIITPSASRLLLSQLWTSDFCFLDNFGHTQSLDCLDCRWGDCYPMANPETVRMCLKNIQAVTLPNKHQNMLRKDIRRHTLEVILVKRDTQTTRRTQLPLGYILSSAFGWSIWVGLTIFTGLFHCYWALGFLVSMPLTGIIISLFYSPGPRKLRNESPSEGAQFNRLIVVTEQMNATKWRAFYGESRVLNSLLCWPLQMGPNSIDTFRRGESVTVTDTDEADSQATRQGPFADYVMPIMHLVLRTLILAQWILAIAAAALQGWDAYAITFWVVLCIFAHTYLFSASRTTADWARQTLGLQFRLYRVPLSSRRTLLSTLVALNPDTFEESKDQAKGGGDTEHNPAMREAALGWLDPILKAGESRKRWLTATGLLATCIDQRNQVEEWKRQFERDYWAPFVEEGIEVCKVVQAQLSKCNKSVV